LLSDSAGKPRLFRGCEKSGAGREEGCAKISHTSLRTKRVITSITTFGSDALAMESRASTTCQ
jgi:hypothetical protein